MNVDVSVIIPTYNAAGVVRRAVDSALAQTFTAHEIIVIDDGSTDNTAQVLAAYGDRVRYVYQVNQERCAARNHGLRLARGRYAAFLDADDYWTPDKLARQVAALDQHADWAMVFSRAQCVYAGQPWPRVLGTDFDAPDAHAPYTITAAQLLAGLLLGKSLPTCTVVARTAALLDVGGFDTGIVIGEDWDVWLRLAQRQPAGCVPDMLAYYQLSGQFQPASLARHRAPDTRLRSVEKLRPLPIDLENKALARAWWYGALIDYAVNAMASGQERWARALQLDRAFFTTEWIESLIAFAMHQHDTLTPAAAAEEFVQRLFQHLPLAARALHAQQRAVIGRLRAGYGFEALARHDLPAAQQHLRAAARYYPPLLKNRGLVSICLRGTWLDKLRRPASTA